MALLYVIFSSAMEAQGVTQCHKVVCLIYGDALLLPPLPSHALTGDKHTVDPLRVNQQQDVQQFCGILSKLTNNKIDNNFVEFSLS